MRLNFAVTSRSFPLNLLIVFLIHHFPRTATAIDFLSAKAFNLCAALHNGGYGPGRTEFETISAECITLHKIKIRCRTTRPRAGVELPPEIWDCPEPQFCIPAPGDKLRPDASCMWVPTEPGLKNPDDPDGHACSAGFKVGRNGMYILSTIRTDEASSMDSVTECKVTIIELYLAPETTYQACITVGSALTHAAVAFHWYLNGLQKGSGKRDEGGSIEEVRPLAEMGTIEKRVDRPGVPNVEIHLDE
ncbi:Calcium-binding protein [Teratosphaeria destructans]|uniref:Calcium-binding protein n=1 Tax=Teratosphaeria destructans TaxID=418781 RepID=A0A9W7SP54_9PEZI|nr:Calcium-binding protein [Teratosphaeria destructans]